MSIERVDIDAPSAIGAEAGRRGWQQLAHAVISTAGGATALHMGAPWWLAVICSASSALSAAAVGLLVHPRRFKAWLEEVEDLLPVATRVLGVWRLERQQWRRRR
jgi:hypothetical protein